MYFQFGYLEAVKWLEEEVKILRILIFQLHLFFLLCYC